MKARAARRALATPAVAGAPPLQARASVIIGFTPFHLLPMRAVLPWMEGDAYFFHPNIEGAVAAAADRSVRFLGRCNDPERPRIAKYLHAGREIEELTRRYAEVAVYLPHPHNPLSNRAFFHPRIAARYIYQDGLLNYYDAPSPLASPRQWLLRAARAAVAGLPYRSYTGHLSGVDSRPVSGGFFTHPQRIARAEKFPLLTRIDLHQPADAAPVAGCGTLFLDQPIEAVVAPDAAMEMRRRALEYVNALDGPVHYKPHYSQKRVVTFDPAWHVVEGTLAGQPAESVVTQLGVANVVSFFTSALANIAVGGTGIVCHALAAHLVPVAVDGRPATLADLLAGFGVKIVDLGLSRDT